MHWAIHFVIFDIFSIVFFCWCHYIRWCLLLSGRRADIIIVTTGDKFVATIRHVIIFVISRSIWFVKVTLLVVLSIWRWWWTISFALTKLKVIFIKSTTNVWSLLSGASTTTINTANTFLLWCAIYLYLAPYFFFALFTHIRKSEYIPVWIQKCKWRILFVI